MIEQLARYPLKSAQGESVTSMSFGSQGPLGDRAWACIDGDGIVASAKHPRRWGRLLHVLVRTAGADVLVQVPGGAELAVGTAAADVALSDWLGAPVTLSRTVPTSPRLHRLYPRQDGLRASWVADHDEDTITPMGRAGVDRFVDFGPVHIVTTADLDRLVADGAPDAEWRRFRPNMVLDVPRPLGPGDRVQLSGGVELEVTLPSPRCAVPGAEQPGIPAAPAVLRAVGRRRTTIAGLGTAACVGVYADVITEGIATVGERVRVLA
jgi:uncharacterized protein YcbX